MPHVSRIRKRTAPAVIIARRHQSAPAEHPAERAIKKAAEEISSGRYIPELDEGQKFLDSMGIALGLGKDGVAKGEKPTLEDFRATRDLNQIANHPRVVEALKRMEQEVEKSTNPQQAIEASWAIHDMQTEQRKRFRWDGQQRWQGKESDEMRKGRVLTPHEFHEQLCKVIGSERVLLSRHAVKTDPNAKSARCGLYVKNPDYKGEAPSSAGRLMESARLQREAEKVITKAKKLRNAKHNAEADQNFELAGEMIEEATKIRMEVSTEHQLWPPEFLRVGTLQWPCGTEWMMMRFDEFGVPLSPRFIGWRTALLTMVRVRAITEREANRAFPIASGPAADWYREQLQMMRNSGVGS